MEDSTVEVVDELAGFGARGTARDRGRLALRPGIATGFFGYGYQTWIFPGERRMFALLGVRGQSIFVDLLGRLVMVHTAVCVRVPASPRPYGQPWCES